MSGTIAAGFTVPLYNLRSPGAQKQDRHAACCLLVRSVLDRKLTGSSASSSDQEISQLNVEAAVIKPAYRSTPWAAERVEAESGRQGARLLFVSESNVCRSVLAEAVMRQLLGREGLADIVDIESKGTRDYNVGDGPDPTLSEVATELGVTLPHNFAARVLHHETDIVQFDLLLVMDKFTAADVLREVSVYDTINPAGNYSMKVRRLGEFIEGVLDTPNPDDKDINDPLYGNYGGEAEKEAVRGMAKEVMAACEGLLHFLQRLQAPVDQRQETSFRQRLTHEVNSLSPTKWLVPPMLSRK